MGQTVSSWIVSCKRVKIQIDRVRELMSKIRLFGQTVSFSLSKVLHVFEKGLIFSTTI